MTRTRRKHYRQLASFYSLFVATSFLWHPRSVEASILVGVVAFGIAPWVILSQTDRLDM